jgi:phage terminase small subunit
MRGRRRQPDAIKALRGNPHQHRLHLEWALGGTPPPRQHVKIEMPDFLKHARERKLFMTVVTQHTESRIARPADALAYARWASYVHMWITAKEKLGSPTYRSKSKHGALRRKRPEFAAVLDLEKALQRLETQLGLNPVARQSILSGMAMLPPALAAVFENETDDEPPASRPSEAKPRQASKATGGLSSPS